MIVCVKSAVHFIADYKRVAAEIIFAKTPGANPCNLAAVPYTQLRSVLRLRPGGPFSEKKRATHCAGSNPFLFIVCTKSWNQGCYQKNEARIRLLARP